MSFALSSTFSIRPDLTSISNSNSRKPLGYSSSSDSEVKVLSIGFSIRKLSRREVNLLAIMASLDTFMTLLFKPAGTPEKESRIRYSILACWYSLVSQLTLARSYWIMLPIVWSFCRVVIRGLIQQASAIRSRSSSGLETLTGMIILPLSYSTAILFRYLSVITVLIIYISLIFSSNIGYYFDFLRAIRVVIGDDWDLVIFQEELEVGVTDFSIYVEFVSHHYGYQSRGG